MTDPLKKFGKLYTDIAIQLLSVILILIILEVFVRVFFEEIKTIDLTASTLKTDSAQAPYFQMHPFSAFSWIPNAKFAKQTVNQLGFVSTEDFSFEKNKNEIRIVTLGGSSTVGNGNRDKQTYPMFLQQMLRKKFPDRQVSVINAAAGGYTTIESLGYLNSRIRYLKPDIILVMHAWNDMYYFTKPDEEISKWRENFNLQAMWDKSASIEKEDPMPAHVQYLSWSQLYLHIVDWVRHRSKADTDQAIVLEKRYSHVSVDGDKIGIKFQPINQNALTTYSDNLNLIREYCELQTISCYSILQPTLISENSNMSGAKRKKAEEKSALYHAFSFDEHIEVFKKMYEVNLQIFGDDNTIDAREMNGLEEFFSDHIHQNSKGTNKLAGIVHERIQNDEIFQ